MLNEIVTGLPPGVQIAGYLSIAIDWSMGAAGNAAFIDEVNGGAAALGFFSTPVYGENGSDTLWEQVGPNILMLSYNGVGPFPVKLLAIPDTLLDNTASYMAQLIIGSDLITGLLDSYGNPIPAGFGFPATIYVANSTIFDIVAQNAYVFGNPGQSGYSWWGSEGGTPSANIGPNSLIIQNLPTTDPAIAGAFWNYNGQIVTSGFTPGSSSDLISQDGSNNLTVGSGVYGAFGTNSVALGYEAYVNGTGSVALGANSVAYAFNSIAGPGSTAYSNQSVAFGGVASGQGAVAIGSDVNALGSYSVSIGESCRSLGDWSWTDGYLTQALEAGAAAHGSQAVAWAPWYWALSNGSPSSNQMSQYSFWIPFNTTTDATPTLLGVPSLNGNIPDVMGLTFPDSIHTALIEFRIVARRTDVPGTISVWECNNFVVDGDGVGSYRVVGSPTVTVNQQDAAASSWSATPSLSGNTVQIEVIGEIGSTIVWTCTMKLYEVSG
jgi:hypothetical protein